MLTKSVPAIIKVRPATWYGLIPSPRKRIDSKTVRAGAGVSMAVALERLIRDMARYQRVWVSAIMRPSARASLVKANPVTMAGTSRRSPPKVFLRVAIVRGE